MLKQLRELHSLLTGKQRRKLLGLQLLIIIMAFAEIVSVVAIGPFMSLVGDMDRLHGDGIMGQLYQASGFETPQGFMTLVGIGVLVALVIAGLFSMFTTWRLSLYGAHVGAELSSRLYRYYMHQPWLFHSSGSSGLLISRVSQESQRITTKIINPVLQLNAKLVMVSLMGLALVVYNPMVALTGIAIFIVTYLLLYKTVRRLLITNGKQVSRSHEDRFRLMTEGFGGIKEVLLLRRQGAFTGQFDKASRHMARGTGLTQALSDAPRYAIEVVAYGSVIFLVLFLLNTHQGDLGAILPMLSIYALAGFKLLPAFQKIYSSVSNMRGNMSAFEAIRGDLKASHEHDLALRERTANHDLTTAWVPRRDITLDNVTFHYPGKDEPALDGLSLTIPAQGVVGLVGASGSGKSTAVDLLLGLIMPERGHVRIDDAPLTEANRGEWQNAVGFVPQHIFLADASVRENVAFGIPQEEIDDDRVQAALQMAQLDALVAAMPEGLETHVGERGVQLSGGQRQRIGIARALYQQPHVLVLDEATSALDGITEKLVMADIQKFSQERTIVMVAHRLATVKGCDLIYLVAEGKVQDCGTYDELVDRNSVFRKMASL